MYFPYFRYGCNFEINAARTAAYVSNRCDVCSDSIKGTIEIRHNCEILNYALTIDEEGDDVIVPASYTTPQADAPWADDSYPPSNRFLGMIIDRVAKPSHVSRSVSQKVSGFGGGILESLRAGAQEFEFEVLLFACDEEAMEYGFRYLTNGLVGGGCDPECTLCEFEYRDSCVEIGEDPPTVEEYNQGLWVLRNVGVTRAPEWVDPPVEGMNYYVRRARFALASELPWKYKCPVVCAEDATFEVPAPTLPCGADFEQWFCGQAEVICAVNEPLLIGETGVYLELWAGTKTLSGIQLQLIPDEYGWAVAPETAPVGYVPEPCEIVHVRDLPAGYRLVYDTTVEQVQVITNTGLVLDGTPFMSFDGVGNPPSFPTVRCGSFAARILVDDCSVTDGVRATIKTIHREL